MSDHEKEKWDRRYAAGEYTPRPHPAPLLEDWIDRIPRGRALDVACGAGRNALRLAEAGFDVEAIDISQAALDMAAAEAARRGLDIVWRQADLDHLDLGDDSYDLITVIRYRNRALWPRLIAALAPDGWLLAEHHMKSTLPVDGPATPEFRLDPQELLEESASLRILFYSETLEAADKSQGTYAIQRLVACNGDPGF
jgi:tellurite methyltransferase